MSNFTVLEEIVLEWNKPSGSFAPVFEAVLLQEVDNSLLAVLLVTCSANLSIFLIGPTASPCCFQQRKIYISDFYVGHKDLNPTVSPIDTIFPRGNLLVSGL